MADEMLRFRDASGEYKEIAARVDDEEFPAGEFLTTRTVWLEDGTPNGRELHQHQPVRGSRRQDGYARLDNEILAGRRLHQLAGWVGYPREVARLRGDEATSADPYALFEPTRGESLRDACLGMFEEEFDRFLTGLLTAMCWLAGAGISHRLISPDTVLWDSESVQVTDFSRSAPFGMARTPVSGSFAWVARESRPDTCYGTVGPADDAWAAVRLIYFVRTRGGTLEDFSQLAAVGLAQMFNGLLECVFGPPESRPTASDLIQHGLRRPHLVPGFPDASGPLIKGRATFLNVRERKHQITGLQAEVPGEFWDDLAWRGGPWGRGNAPPAEAR